MRAHLRIARPVSDLPATAAMYQQGLGLEVIGQFHDHDGFDGVMLGTKGENFHFKWAQRGRIFEDRDGYRVVMARAACSLVEGPQQFVTTGSQQP